MNSCGYEDIYLSQLIAGILLYKRRVSGNELCKIISLMFKLEGTCVIELEEASDIYDYVGTSDSEIYLMDEYNYDTKIKFNGKRISLFDYLKINTTQDVIDFLENNMNYKQCFIEKKELFLDRFNRFFPGTKRKVRMKRGVI